jgi:predicted MPP superfamily phosphohydrolase
MEAIAVAGWTWMGIGFYLSLSVLALGAGSWIASRPPLRRAPMDPERRVFLSRAVAGGAAAATAGLTGYGAWRAYAPAEVTELSVKLARLPRALDGLTIAQVTDIHVGPTIGRKFLDDMVARVNALKPDLVAVTGDLVDGSVEELGPTVAALQRLTSRYGSWFITGNHEYYSGDSEWCDALQRMGLNVLRNERAVIGDAGASFDLAGVDDWSGQGERPYDLDKALAGREPDRSLVLLAHQPANFDAAAQRGVELQLSGHTHGGQMFPFSLAVAAVHPYSRGFYRSGAGQLYVSRGTGYWGPPFRVGSPPEIVKVTLLAG